MEILIRTDGGVHLGNGHIIRMMALAAEFTKRKISFSFALKFDDFWINILQQKGYAVQKIQSHAELPDLIVKKKITHVVYDTRYDMNVNELTSMQRQHGVKLVVIDSPEDTRLAANVVLFPPIPQVNEWSWAGFDGKIYCGWEYVLLRSEFSEATIKHPQGGKVVLSFGSTDPYKLSEWAIGEISKNADVFGKFKFTLMVGPQFDRLAEVRKTPGIETMNLEIIQAPKDIVGVFQSADFAMIALGVTAYELAALGVPFLFASISSDHARSGEAFTKNGLGYSLGTIGKSLDGFREKTKPFVTSLTEIKKTIEDFSKHNKISDWNEIIKAITE